MDELDVIEAFVDGAAVDPSALRSALASAEARDHLVDVLVLRGLVSEQTPARRRIVHARSRPGLGRWAPAAAVIALVGGITGYVAGVRSSAPPTASSSAVTSVTVPPAPTEIIHLRAGAGWTEHGGGE